MKEMEISYLVCQLMVFDIPRMTPISWGLVLTGVFCCFFPSGRAPQVQIHEHGCGLVGLFLSCGRRNRLFYLSCATQMVLVVNGLVPRNQAIDIGCAHCISSQF